MDYIPIVDFSKLVKGTPSKEDWKSTAEEVYRALSGIGFVYLKNHGIDSGIINKAFTESRNFFELPSNIKEKTITDASKGFNGYTKPGQENLSSGAPVYEIRESYDFCGNLRYYPSEDAPNFGPCLEKLEEASKFVIKQLMRVLAISLELEDREYFVKKFMNLDSLDVPSYTGFRTLYYPPTWDKNIPAGTVRCADHTDYGMITLLYQDTIGGLEVKSVNGNWVSAKPIPNTVLINTGDLLEFWSGGMFPATHHRVLIPEAELKQKAARQSIVYFTHPDDSVLIHPLKNANKIGLKEYKPVSAKEHAKKRLDISYNYQTESKVDF